MYKNTGSAIKTFAIVVFALGLLSTVIGFLTMLITGIQAEYGLMIGMAFFELIVGVIISYLVGLLIAGFAEIILNTRDIKESIHHLEEMTEFEYKEYVNDKEIKENDLDGIYYNSDNNYIKIKDGLFEHTVGGERFMYGTVTMKEEGEVVLMSKDKTQCLTVQKEGNALKTKKGIKFIKK